MGPEMHTFERQVSKCSNHTARAIYASLFGQFGLPTTFFCCFSYTEAQLDHQIWPKAKGKPLHTKLVRKVLITILLVFIILGLSL